jgi:hypothetical protein
VTVVDVKLPDNTGRSNVRNDLTMLAAVPGDSTRVDKLMDCSKLPDSVTGVKLKPGIGVGTETLIWWDTLRLAWLLLSPSTFHAIDPLRSAWDDVAVGGGSGETGLTRIVPFIQL